MRNKKNLTEEVINKKAKEKLKIWSSCLPNTARRYRNHYILIFKNHHTKANTIYLEI